jgi:hypothetical protein
MGPPGRTHLARIVPDYRLSLFDLASVASADSVDTDSQINALKPLILILKYMFRHFKMAAL